MTIANENMLFLRGKQKQRNPHLCLSVMPNTKSLSNFSLVKFIHIGLLKVSCLHLRALKNFYSLIMKHGKIVCFDYEALKNVYALTMKH